MAADVHQEDIRKKNKHAAANTTQAIMYNVYVLAEHVTQTILRK